MLRASIGGGDAAPRAYRHSLIRLMMPLLAPLSGSPQRPGWSVLAPALGAVLMSWDAAPTPAQRFESVLAVLDNAPSRRRRTGRTYQGFVKALTLRSAAVLDLLVPHLRTLTERAAGKRWCLGEFIPIGVDGRKIDAPRTTANEDPGLAGKDTCGPQMLARLLVHLGAMLPWGWKIGGAGDAERPMRRQMLDLLPEHTLRVADAGFTGFDLLSGLKAGGIIFLVRVGRNVRLLRELGYSQRAGKSVVYLWPDDKRGKPPLVLRLICVGPVYLITDVTDPRRLSKKAAAESYRRRWGLEVAFGTLKQTPERRKVRSCTPARARAELAWLIAGPWVLTLVGVRAIQAAGRAPRRLSAAGVPAAVRHAAHARPSGRTPAHRLRRCVLDRVVRNGRKAAYRRPHKKNPPPPGEPTITTATPAQVQEARELRRKKTAQ